MNEITSSIYSDYFIFDTSGQRKVVLVYIILIKKNILDAEQLKIYFLPIFLKFSLLKKYHYIIENNYFHNYNFSKIFSAETRLLILMNLK